MLKRRYQICLLIAVVLAIFYPALFGEFNSIDDIDMVSGLLNTNDWSLKGIFVPKSAGGHYYRPLLYLTFLFDRFGWFLSSSFMHLENILFHLANTLLVFFLALELLPENERSESYLPLVASLLFAVHPIVTEPVNWISGRTDVMAGTFVLMTALALVKFKSRHKKRFIVISTVSFLMAILTKEVALAFLPGAVFILLAGQQGEIAHVSPGRPPQVNKHVVTVMLITVFASTVFAFYYLRSAAFTSNSSQITMTLRFMFTDIDHTLLVFLRDIGFYMKKIFYPFPLNFAILEVDPLYEVLAVPIVMVAVYLIFNRSLLSAIFLSGAFLITPALPVSFNQIAWTPYAERYVYIASAFIIIASVFFASSCIGRINSRNLVRAGTFVLILVMAAATFRRNLVWRTNLSLFKDTTEKSPNFSKAWNEYGVALYKMGDLEAAKEKFIKAGSLYSFEYDDVSESNLAVIYLKQGKEDEALEIFRGIIKKSKGKSARGYEGLISCLERKDLTRENPADNRHIMLELQECYGKLYALTAKPFILYKLGRLSLSLDERQKALGYFRSAYEQFPEGDMYKSYAKKIVARLEKE